MIPASEQCMANKSLGKTSGSDAQGERIVSSGEDRTMVGNCKLLGRPRYVGDCFMSTMEQSFKAPNLDLSAAAPVTAPDSAMEDVHELEAPAGNVILRPGPASRHGQCNGFRHVMVRRLANSASSQETAPRWGLRSRTRRASRSMCDVNAGSCLANYAAAGRRASESTCTFDRPKSVGRKMAWSPEQFMCRKPFKPPKSSPGVH